MNIADRRYRTMSWALLTPLIALLLLCAASPLATAGDINVVAIDDQVQTLNAEESVTYHWAVYNNGNTSVLLLGSVYTTGHEGVSYSFETDSIILDPGESVIMILTFTATRDAASADMSFIVNLTATDLTDPAMVETHTQEVDLKVISIFGINAGQNKIMNIWSNDLPSPLDGNEGAFIVSTIGWVIVGLLFYFVVDPLVHFLTRKTKTELDDILLRILRMPVFLLIVLIGTVTSIEILNIDPNTLTDIETYYHIALILIGSWLAYKIYAEVILYYAKHFAAKSDTELDDVLVPVLEKIGMILIPFLAMMLIFDIFGYDVTVLLAGAGFMAIVVGYAAQSTLANFFAGINILVGRPFKVGDVLSMDGDLYEVKHIGLRATELLDTTSNQLAIIPNDTMCNNKIVNAVLPDRELTITVVVGVAYGSDIEEVKQLMTEAVAEMPGSNKEKKANIRLSDFADSAINMKIFIPIEEATNKWKAASDFREILYKKFNAAGIEIPFPQQVVYLKNEQKDG